MRTGGVRGVPASARVEPCWRRGFRVVVATARGERVTLIEGLRRCDAWELAERIKRIPPGCVVSGLSVSPVVGL